MLLGSSETKQTYTSLVGLLRTTYSNCCEIWRFCYRFHIVYLCKRETEREVYEREGSGSSSKKVKRSCFFQNLENGVGYVFWTVTTANGQQNSLQHCKINNRKSLRVSFYTRMTLLQLVCCVFHTFDLSSSDFCFCGLSCNSIFSHLANWSEQGSHDHWAKYACNLVRRCQRVNFTLGGRCGLVLWWETIHGISYICRTINRGFICSLNFSFRMKCQFSFSYCKASHGYNLGDDDVFCFHCSCDWCDGRHREGIRNGSKYAFFSRPKWSD